MLRKLFELFNFCVEGSPENGTSLTWSCNKYEPAHDNFYLDYNDEPYLDEITFNCTNNG